MILFEEYFDIGVAGHPYRGNREYLEDGMALLTMLLKGLSGERYNQGGSATGLPARVRAWIDTTRFAGKDDEETEALRDEVQSAVDFINGRKEAGGEEQTLPLLCLLKHFSLDAYSFLALLLAIAPELSTDYLSVYRYLQEEDGAESPTAALLNRLYRLGFGEVPPEDQGLFEDTTDGALLFQCPKKEPEVSRLLYPLRLLPGVTSYLTNGGTIPESPFRFPMPEEVLSDFFAKEAAALKNLAFSGSGNPTIYVESRDYRDVQHVLCALAEEEGCTPFFVDAEAMTAGESPGIRNALAEVLTAIRLKNGFLAVFDESEDVHFARKLMELPVMKHSRGPVFVFGTKKLPAKVVARDRWIPFELPLPDIETRKRVWETCLAKVAETGVQVSEVVDTDELSYGYEISVSSIQSACVASVSAALTEEETVLTKDILGDVLFKAGESDFGELATRIRPSYTWEDIEIEKSQKDVLFVAINRFRMRNRLGIEWGLDKKNAYGNGVSVLLYGPPGTGKTMAAQIIAKELSLPLFRVDLSQLFSKYIGETSKNLAKVFAEASKANVVLFFDEADALFAKRTEVSDSLDKHANAETAYLLQRIDEYRGFSILATNYFQNFDKAFVRRLTYAVHLDSPSAEERLSLWRTILPSTVPMEESIDFELLADKFELSGSNIKSVLYSAAYMAGAEHKKVGPSHIVRALKYEFEKLGKMLDMGDLGLYAGYCW